MHHAVLQDGREVAVKVRREGIANVMAADLALLSGFARAAGVLPGLRRVPVAEMTRQVGGAVSRQLDLPAERAALQDLADNFADLAAVRVPRPVTELCSAETVVMEFVPGLAAYRPETLAADQRKDVVVRTLDHGRSLRGASPVHGDPACSASKIRSARRESPSITMHCWRRATIGWSSPPSS